MNNVRIIYSSLRDCLGTNRRNIMASIENNDKLIATHPELPLSAWILADGTRFIADEGDGSREGDDGFEGLWTDIIGDYGFRNYFESLAE